MVYEGATDNTAVQLRSALDLPSSRLESRNKFHKIIESLETKKQEFVLDVASKMFIRKDVTAKSRYSKILKLFYNAELENVDFSQSNDAVQEMNKWNKCVVSSSTMLLLLNAIYFKGSWKYPFNSKNTALGKFNVVLPGRVPQTKSVPFMNLTQHLYFSESVQLDSKILRLPYQMGIQDMFNANEASFPGIVQDKSVFVSKFIQKSALDVNEEGTEASVATGVIFDDRIGGEFVDFHADHPFLFFIQDETTGTVIFVGKVVDPTTSEAPLRTPAESDVVQSRLGEKESPKPERRNEVSHKSVLESEKEHPILYVQRPNEVVQEASIQKFGSAKETPEDFLKSTGQKIAEMAAKSNPQTAAKLYDLLQTIYQTQTAIIRNI
ncbi:hypothetical protein C0J52_11362 [Blattella germanica]|nr:hypothetical protein C0J52_11362 [Blattella germanica]